DLPPSWIRARPRGRSWALAPSPARSPLAGALHRRAGPDVDPGWWSDPAAWLLGALGLPRRWPPRPSVERRCSPRPTGAGRAWTPGRPSLPDAPGLVGGRPARHR